MNKFYRFTIYIVIISFIANLLQINISKTVAAPISPAKYRTLNLSTKTNKKIELVNEKTRFSNTFLLPNGHKQKVVSLSPLNYETNINKYKVWKSIDTSLVKKNSLDYSNKANNFNLTISKDISGKGVKLSQKNSTLNFALKSIGTQSASKSPSKSQVSINKNSVTFLNASKYINIIYHSTPQGIKEEVILKKYTKNNVFSFQLKLSNVFYKRLSTGAYFFYNKTTKKPIYYLPQSFMTDSKKSAQFPDGVISYNVKTQIIPNKSGYILRQTADNKWLSSKIRKYPVTIDPSFTVYENYGEDSFTQTGYPNINSWDQMRLYLGRTSSYGKGVTRTFTPFFFDNLTNARINSAHFRAYQYYCANACTGSGVTARLTGGYDPKAITWNNMPWISDSVGHTSDNGTNKWIDIDVTTAAKYWFEWGNTAGSQMGSLAFTQDDESNWGQRNWWAANDTDKGPELTIDYNDYGASYGIDSLAGDIRVDDEISLTARVRNNGRNTWHTSDTKLSYHIYDAIGNRVIQDGIYNDLPNDIGGGGGYAEFPVKIKMPSTPGNYIVKWDLIQPGITWFSDQGIATQDYLVHVDDYPEYNATYQPVNVPDHMVANSTINIPINIHNGSRRSWPTDQFKISYHWYNNNTNSYTIWNGIQTTLPNEVPARDAWVTVNMQVKTPYNPGNYRLQIDMVQPGVTWFSQKDVPTADYNTIFSPSSGSATTHMGSEDFYTKIGPVDLATGNLAYSSMDMSLASSSGLLSVARSYNANSLDNITASNQIGYIQSWLLNGPYQEDDSNIRLSKPYIVNEEQIRPNTFTTTNNKSWLKASTLDSGIDNIDIRQVLNDNNVIDYDYVKNSVVYLHTYAYSPISRNTILSLNSDGNTKVWLNSQIVDTQTTSCYYVQDCHKINVTLNAGWNSLLVKTAQANDNSWNIAARFIDDNTYPLMNTVQYSLDNQEIFGDYQLLGKGWTTNFNEKLFTSESDNIYYRNSTGSINLYTTKPDGTFKRPTGSSMDLVKNADNSYSLIYKSGLRSNFSAQGKLTSRVELSGNTITYQYDSTGNCIKILDGSRYIILGYVGNRLVSITDPLGNKYSYEYDSVSYPWKLIKVTDPNGNFFTYTYNAKDKMEKFTGKRNYPTTIAYNASNQVTDIKDALNNSTKFNYSPGKTEITDALNHKTTAEFDSNNLLIASTNAKQYREFYQYDGNYNLTSVTPDIPENDGYFYRYTFTYDNNDNILSETDPLDKSTKFEYLGNDLIKNTSPDNTFTTNTYSTDGKRLLISTTDAKNNITSFTYNSIGRINSTTDPEGNTTSSTYSPDSDMLTATTPKGEITRYSYDAIGRKISDTTPLGKTTTYNYNSNSKLIKTTDPGGLSLQYTYDKNDNLLSEINPNGTTRTYQYNPLDQVIKTTDEGGAVMQYQYDALGNKIKTIDANGKITSTTYDELNNVISQVDSSGSSTDITYNRNNQPELVTDEKKQSSAQTFDKLGQVSEVKDKESTNNYSYDTDGNLIKATSTLNSENVTAVYDKNQNITDFKSNLIGNINTSYNDNDNPTTIKAPTANIDIAYDANGQVNKISSSIASNGPPPKPPADPPASAVMSVPSGVTSQETTLATQFTRDAEGKLTNITKANGDTTQLSYDLSNRVTAITNRNNSRALLAKFSYQFDNASNVTAVYEDRTKILNTYAYDARNQLIRENNTNYSYDLMGNRKTITDASGTTTYEYETGDSNRLKKITFPAERTVAFEYDANGNITKRIDSTNGTTTYTYDSDNYFTKATLPDGKTIEYTYDKILKLRTMRTETLSGGQQTSTKYIYDGSRLVSETDMNGRVIRSYTWDENENLISIALPDSTGKLIAYNYVKNAKEDIVALTDSSGTIVAEYRYDAWGNILQSSTRASSPVANIDKLNPRLYSGYWYDSSLGLYFMKTRMYDPSIGRFLSEDTAINDGSALALNPYIYCSNSPVDRIDPSGQFDLFGKVKQYASSAVQAIGRTWNNMWAGVVDSVNTVADYGGPVSSTIAKAINRTVDWCDKPWKVAAVAIGVGIVGGLILAGASAAASVIIPIISQATISTYATIAAGVTSIAPKIQGTYTVYMSKAGDYVGMTKNLTQRSTYWASQATPRYVQPIKGLTNLTYLQARAAEQALIEYYGGPKGPILTNAINSISVNSARYQNLVPNARLLIQALGFK